MKGRRIIKLITCIICIVVAFLPRNAEPSIGDRLVVYRQCLKEYKPTLEMIKYDADLGASNFIKRYVHRTMREEHMNMCIRRIDNTYKYHNLPRVKFYGRWAFRRIAGIDEPASTAFSLFNLILGIYYLIKLKRTSDERGYKRNYIAVYIAMINSWTASSIYHARGKYHTEVLDYCAAALYLVTTLDTMITRTLNLKNSEKLGKRTCYIIRKIVHTLAACLYVSHVRKLTSRRPFNYKYNLEFNTAVGLSSVAVIIIWCITVNKAERNISSKLLRLIILTVAIASLEIYEFPPILGLFDAHSLWHLSTAIVYPFISEIFIEDLQGSGAISNDNPPYKKLERTPSLPEESTRGLKSRTSGS